MTTSNRKFALTLFVLLAGICSLSVILAVLCVRSLPAAYAPAMQTLLPGPEPAPDSFPRTDIVYQRNEELGFINADGSGGTTFLLRIPRNGMLSSWGAPFFLGDNETLVLIDDPWPYSGKIYIVRPGQIALYCNWRGFPRPAADGHHIWVETEEGETHEGQIKKYLPEDCGTTNRPEKKYQDVTGAVSPDEQYAAEVLPNWALRVPYLIIRNLQTGEKKIIGEGSFPFWSRDGGWLAYTGPDGIYIVQNSPEAEPRRLVALEAPDRELGGRVYSPENTHLYYPPLASWSPDGKWLVYHEYHMQPVDPGAQFAAQYYSIMKVNVETGETIKLVDGGYYPSWRWPAQEP